MEKVAAAVSVDVSISVVSHSQILLVKMLLDDLELHCGHLNFELILTLNLAEEIPFLLDKFSYPIKVIRNFSPLGFGANHNQAFGRSAGRFFCVVNPDIRVNGNPFDELIASLADPAVGVVAPLVLGGEGGVEDSARQFPSPFKIMFKAFGKGRAPDYIIHETPIYPDWVGGMFMLMPRGVFERLGGFDERYFLYYEDVNLCGRMALSGLRVVLNPIVKVTHHAQRSSHRNAMYLRWHLMSMMRFFLSAVYWRLLFMRKP